MDQAEVIAGFAFGIKRIREAILNLFDAEGDSDKKNFQVSW